MNELTPALNIIRQFEGCRLVAYRDPIGILTIGWGSTAGVVSGETITQSTADQMLYNDVVDLASRIKAIVIVPINNNQLCALISFAYNLGLGALYHSTLLRELNRGADKVTVAEQFLLWVHAGGYVLQGLVERRKAESSLFIS